MPKKGYKQTEEHKQKNAFCRVGKPSAMKGKKQSEIAKQKVSKSLIGNKRSFGKKRSEETRKRNSLTMIGNRNAFGFKHSIEFKEKQRQKMIGNQLNKERKYSPETIEKRFRHGRGGHKKYIYDGKNGIILMRSNWEVLYAQKLDNENLDWSYEPTKFFTPFGYYFPDFFIKQLDEYHEIKGYFSDAAKNKVNFAKSIVSIKVLSKDKNGEFAEIPHE